MLPPRGFIGAGTLSRAERSPRPPVREAQQPIAARLVRGLRYEHAVAKALMWWAGLRGVDLAIGPWFRFANAPLGAWRWCQPDAIIDPPGARPLLILEVKLAFEPRAWWQLAELYRPVVAKATGRQVNIAAICGSFDPAMRSRIPVGIAVSPNPPSRWLAYWLADSTEVSEPLPVLQWKRPSAESLDA